MSIEYKKILVLTDNELLYSNMKEFMKNKMILYNFEKLDFRYSYNNNEFLKKFMSAIDFKAIDIKDYMSIIQNYDLVFSFHCKQLFPKELINSMTCINIHPGYNPYNRGWYPQVFSIINGLPIGATIHLMDEKLDHGPIIDQKQTSIEAWDTSLSLYNKIIDLETYLIEKNFDDIIKGNFKYIFHEHDGNINLKNDFITLQEIDLDKTDKFRNFLNHIRALTHGEYRNCYFYDDDGNKVYIKIILEKETRQ